EIHDRRAACGPSDVVTPREWGIVAGPSSLGVSGGRMTLKGPSAWIALGRVTISDLENASGIGISRGGNTQPSSGVANVPYRTAVQVNRRVDVAFTRSTRSRIAAIAASAMLR